MTLSPRTRQYILYALSICTLLAVVPWWYLKNNQEYLLYRQGDYFYSQEDFENAARYYSLAFEKGVNKPQLLNRLGDTYLALQEFGRALEVFLEMKAVMPENLSVKVKLAHVYSLNDMTDRALSTINQVLDIEPNQDTVLLWKARILAQDGQFQEAIEIYHDVLGK